MGRAGLPAPTEAASTTTRADRDELIDVRKSVVTALVVAAVSAAVGAALLADRPPRWEATSSLVVFPVRQDSPDVPSLYGSLSRGQVVYTLARVVSASPPGGADVVVQAVPDSSLITITASADNAGQAEVATGAALARSLVSIGSLDLPYGARAVATGDGTAELVSPSLATLAVVVVFDSLVLALVVQQVTAALGRRWRPADDQVHDEQASVNSPRVQALQD